MYGLFGIVLLVAGRAFLLRIARWRSGRPERENRLDGIPRRIGSLLDLGLFQSKVAGRLPAGFYHILMFGGFIVLTLATLLVAIQLDLGIRILDGPFYVAFKIAVDAFGLLLLAGCAGTIAKRAASPSPGYLRGPGELFPVVLLSAVGATGFLVETLRLAATKPSVAAASFVSHAFTPLLSGYPFDALLSAHAVAWWLHLGLAFVFLGSIPCSKLVHLATGPASIFLRSARPAGALQIVPRIEEEERPGVTCVADFSWKQLLSVDACTRCGRCQDECPAFAAAMPLSPRDVVLRSAAALHEEGFASPLPRGSIPVCERDRFAHEVLTPGAIWSCTTCRACVEACPVSIEHVDMIVDVRRGFVAEGKIPDTARSALRRMGDTGNPWGLPQDDRLDWAEGLGIPLASEKPGFEYLFWVGCAAAYDPRIRKVSRAIATLLRMAGVDFAILGPEETCCGESARRLGEEGLFVLGTVANIKETFERYGVRKVITGCPHCYNTFLNEFPPLGVSVSVHHHSRFLSELLKAGRLATSRPLDGPVAFHDSCYLGRYNGIYDPPRELLSAISGLDVVEAENRRARSFCCGAGGGAMWLELPGQRINNLRFDQLRRTGARAIASCCPYCLTMFDDAVKFNDLQDTFRTRDISEFLLDAMAQDPGGQE
jgi:Fe-S oxidoreductase/nitrate reductase gamma subunit